MEPISHFVLRSFVGTFHNPYIYQFVLYIFKTKHFYIIVTISHILGIDISKDIEQITSGVPFTPSKASEILVPEQEVRFFLSTKQKKNVTISKSNIEPVEASKPVKVIIHGWTENASYHGNDYYKRITDAYLEKSDFNIITVDWDKPAHKNYITSSASTQGVGRHVGNLLEKIHTEKKVELKDIHIIGHSLGAHVAGFAAKRVTQLARSKIWQVTGLDPAGPLFETPPEPKQNRLSDTDASIVEVVHTDGGVFGFLTPLGTVDFYPNGGVPTQPNCNPLDNGKNS